MKKMKKKYFIKPFSSVYVNKYLTLKEKWGLALRDPAYLIGWFILICLIVFIILI